MSSDVLWKGPRRYWVPQEVVYCNGTVPKLEEIAVYVGVIAGQSEVKGMCRGISRRSEGGEHRKGMKTHGTLERGS